ncbi:MAG: glycosyltransferase family 2 protein [Chitinophagaceae bacterium]
MELLSVVIITFNEEKNIGRCIDSLAGVADEILILDSNSTDNTAEIARQKGATVYQQAFLGYVEQKNKALSLAKHNLVLSLDADEALDKVLRDSILSVKNNFQYRGYIMNRCNNYCGKFIRHGSWYPDSRMRLVDKSVAQWSGDNPHDVLTFTSPQAKKHLKGNILHYSFNSFEEHAAQNNKFSSISADSLFKRGKKTNLFKVVFNPFWAFIRSYLVRLGFLDGFYGFVIAVNIAHLTFLKHSKLYKKKKTIL